MLQAMPLYVQWPDESEKSTYRICIVGPRNPFEREIAANPNILVKGKPLRFLYTTEIGDDLPSAEIYYLALDREPLNLNLAKALRGKPVLRISRVPRFSQRNGDIHFHHKRGRLVFEANQEAILGQGLKVRSQFLRLSQKEERH